MFRLFFIFTTLFWGFGLGLYLLLWLLMPSEHRPHTPVIAAPLSSPSQPSLYPASPPSPRHSPLVTVFALVLGLAAIAVLVSSFAHYMPWFRGFGQPRFFVPDITWHRFPPFGGVLLPHRIPFFPGLLVVTLPLIMLLVVFKSFRVALGCFGVLLALVVIVFLAPVFLPILMIPPLLIVAIPILLILWILKLLLT